MTRTEQTVNPQVHIHGKVSRAAAAYAVEKVEAALQHAPGPVLRASVTLNAAAPGDRVDAHVDVNGTGVHVHAIGETMQEATDLMQERLRSRLHHLRRRPAQGPRPYRFSVLSGRADEEYDISAPAPDGRYDDDETYEHRLAG